LNKVPGSRKLLKPIFSYFINIDDIWMYNYHNRTYDAIVEEVFNATRKL